MFVFMSKFMTVDVGRIEKTQPMKAWGRHPLVWDCRPTVPMAARTYVSGVGLSKLGLEILDIFVAT